MLNKLLSVMVFMAWLVCPAVVAQDPHFHVFVDPVNRSVNLINVSWFVESGELITSTATSRAPMMEFNWTEDDGTHHTLTTEASNTKDWVFETTAIVGLESFENGKLIPIPQGQAPTASFRASWVDAQGVTHEVTTPCPSTTPVGRKAALDAHLEQVKLLQTAFPPRPVTPPPDPAPEEAAFLSSPPKWHKPDPKFHRPELAHKWA